MAIFRVAYTQARGAEIMRRWCQIHLSTALMMTLTAGIILFRNTELNFEDPSYLTEVSGWPLIAYRISTHYAERDLIHDYFRGRGGGLLIPRRTVDKLIANSARWFYGAIAVNALTGIAIVITMAWLCECLIRLRTWRKI